LIVFDFCGVLGDWPTPADRARLEHLAGRAGEDFWADYRRHRPPYDVAAFGDDGYRALCERLGTPPDDIVFVDDRLENVAAAGAEGMRAVHFTDVTALRAALR
jgi:FMN phosphatase YigB (HAD superfamily)